MGDTARSRLDEANGMVRTDEPTLDLVILACLEMEARLSALERQDAARAAAEEYAALRAALGAYPDSDVVALATTMAARVRAADEVYDAQAEEIRRLRARVTELEAPGECQSLHKLRHALYPARDMLAEIRRRGAFEGRDLDTAIDGASAVLRDAPPGAVLLPPEAVQRSDENGDPVFAGVPDAER